MTETKQPVDLQVARTNCELITASEERPGEIFNNLGHMFVLLNAEVVVAEHCQLQPLLCAPTQQSDHHGERIADLQGEAWVLEAFGSGDYTNNGKLAKDLRRLAEHKATGKRTFLALREIALPVLRTLRSGESRRY